MNREEVHEKTEDRLAMIQAAITLAGGDVGPTELAQMTLIDVLRLILPNGLDLHIDISGLVAKDGLCLGLREWKEAGR